MDREGGVRLRWIALDCTALVWLCTQVLCCLTARGLGLLRGCLWLFGCTRSCVTVSGCVWPAALCIGLGGSAHCMVRVCQGALRYLGCSNK